MHAYIITGGTSEERSDLINKMLKERTVSPHDVITLLADPASIGVDNMRSVGVRLSIRPVASNCHAVVVRDAHVMTLEAQNAFLKTLEEPPGDALIILETAQPDALLPTILSRCRIIRLTKNHACDQSDDVMLQYLNTIQQLQTSSAGERLRRIDMIAKTRDDALTFVDLSIHALELHLQMTGRGPVSLSASTNLAPIIVTKLLRSFLTARTHLKGNITPKLTLDAVFLS